jgi:hypothetical protein
LNFGNPITRFILGSVAPLFLEGMIYQCYLFLKPDYEPDFMIFIIFIPLILPLIFFYFLSPYFIFGISRTGQFYRIELNQSINEIFITEKEIFSPEEIFTIREELRQSLIPELARLFRSNYVNHFFQQSQTDSAEESVLGFYETIFLFAFFSSILFFFNGLLTLYLYNNSIIIEHIVIIDQIENFTNILLSASFMFLLAFSSLFLIWLIQRRVRYLIPLVVPGWVKAFPDERIEILRHQIQAIADFNFENLLSTKSQLANSKSFMTPIYLDLLKKKINIIVSETTREQAGKKLAWQKYSEILTKLGISEKKKDQVEESFLSSSLIKSVQQFAFDKREFESIKEDLNFFQSTLDTWEQQTDSEKLSAFLLLYRVAESLFRGILRNLGIEKLGNFGAMSLTLADLGLVIHEEQLILNQVRRQRNFMLHRAGEKIKITKVFADSFLETVENILVRAGELRTISRLNKPQTGKIVTSN